MGVVLMGRQKRFAASLAFAAVAIICVLASMTQTAVPTAARQAQVGTQEVLGTKPAHLPQCPATGTLRVGTDATYPPFESVNEATGNVEGFDIDLLSAIARKEDFRLDVHNTLFDTIYTALSYG